MAKSKKRHSNSSVSVKQRAQSEALADKKDRQKNRMNPTARAILLGDLVFLAVASMLYEQGTLSEFVSNLCTVLGIIFLCVALYFQFGKGSGSSGPRLH